MFFVFAQDRQLYPADDQGTFCVVHRADDRASAQHDYGVGPGAGHELRPGRGVRPPLRPSQRPQQPLQLHGAGDRREERCDVVPGRQRRVLSEQPERDSQMINSFICAMCLKFLIRTFKYLRNLFYIKQCRVSYTIITQKRLDLF